MNLVEEVSELSGDIKDYSMVSLITHRLRCVHVLIKYMISIS